MIYTVPSFVHRPFLLSENVGVVLTQMCLSFFAKSVVGCRLR
jgi:hypothetical protein